MERKPAVIIGKIGIVERKQNTFRIKAIKILVEM